MTREHAAVTYNRAKAATSQVITDLGGLEKAAEFTRVGVPTLSQYQQIREEKVFMPLDVIMDLEARAGTMHITECLAALHNAMVIKLPASPCTPTAEAISKILMATGHLVETAGKAFADNKLTPREQAEMLKEIDATVSCLAAYRGFITDASRGLR